MTLYIDDKPMKIKEALAFLGISEKLVPLHVRRKMIQCKTRQVDRDKVRPPKSIGGKPEYLVYVPQLEKEVKIRVATMQRPDKDGNPTYPHPKSLTLSPAEDGTVLSADIAEFVFWFLRPMNKQSPFRDQAKNWFYEFMDHDAKATSDIEREEKYILAMSIILGPNSRSDIELKHLAKGFNLNNVDDMTPMVIKSELKKLAMKNPADFYNKATSREVIFSGKIQEAIDAGILNLKTVLGMQRWYIGKEEILPLQYGAKPLDSLKSHMADNWHLYQQQIDEQLKGIDLSVKLNNPINDEAFAGTEKVEGKIMAELSPREHTLLAEINKKDYLEERMQRIDNYDWDNPDGWHVSQKKSYEENKELYNAWKKAKELENSASQG